MRLLCISIWVPAHLAPTFCMSVFYHLSFLSLPLPPVRSGRTKSMKKLSTVGTQRNICKPMYTINHNSQKIKGIQVAMDEWMDKENEVYTCNGIFRLFKKWKKFWHMLQHLKTCIAIMLSEIRQSQTKAVCFHSYEGIRIVKLRNRK
jgi:hypothetical protein